MRDRYNLNLLPGMSEDGVEYGSYFWSIYHIIMVYGRIWIWTTKIHSDSSPYLIWKNHWVI